jgi:PncC family amidohydrolase
MQEADIEEEASVRAMALAEKLMRVLIAEGPRPLVLAESCTAGMVSDLLARIPGASGVLWGSFVCYTAEAKISMLGLDSARLERYGLVSKETACDMALGALEKSGASIAAAVTGIAGPDGDGSAVPTGTVWAAAALRGKGIAAAREYHFTGSRNGIRLKASTAVLEILLEITGVALT